MTRHRIADYFRRQPSEQAGHQRTPDESGRTPTVERVPDSQSQTLDAVWDEEWRQNLSGLALDRLKSQISSKHFQVFYLHTIKQQPASIVAKALGINRAQVYLVKHRLTPQFRRIVADLQHTLG